MGEALKPVVSERVISGSQRAVASASTSPLSSSLCRDECTDTPLSCRPPLFSLSPALLHCDSEQDDYFLVKLLHSSPRPSFIHLSSFSLFHSLSLNHSLAHSFLSIFLHALSCTRESLLRRHQRVRSQPDGLNL